MILWKIFHIMITVQPGALRGGRQVMKTVKQQERTARICLYCIMKKRDFR